MKRTGGRERYETREVIYRVLRLLMARVWRRGYEDTGSAVGGTAAMVVLLLLLLLLPLALPVPLPLAAATGGALLPDSNEGNVGESAVEFVAPPLLLGGISTRPVSDCVL